MTAVADPDFACTGGGVCDDTTTGVHGVPFAGAAYRMGEFFLNGTCVAVPGIREKG